MAPELSLLYLPSAVALGALHAIEPGHAKTLTAAYLIGIKGRKRDAILLGISVALTHSLVVVGLAAGAIWLGREALTDDVSRWLQLISGTMVVFLGFWMLRRRLRQRSAGACTAPTHDHSQGHAHGHDHDLLSDDEHARAHAENLPDYVGKGERPSPIQIVAFGAAGGLIPCPASVTVMLMALSVGQAGLGFLTVASFSLGLAITLVGTGLLVVLGLSQLSGNGRFGWISRQAPVISAAMVILSGLGALLFI